VFEMSNVRLNAHAISSVTEELEDMKHDYMTEHGWLQTTYLLESGDCLWAKSFDGARYVVPFEIAEIMEETGLRI